MILSSKAFIDPNQAKYMISIFRGLRLDKMYFIANDEYEKALSKGLRECRRIFGKAVSKQLPYLEEMLKPDEPRTEKDLGTRDIPLKRIVGTASSSRQNAFSPNFLPILSRDTEFADKWVHVYMHQMKEGLRDAIETFEYKGLHYVREGNKRVSVMKWLGGSSIQCHVIRLIPELNPTDMESRRYHASLLFEKTTGISTFWFSTEAGFDAMTRLMERYAAPQPLSPATCRSFMDTVHSPFRFAFKDLGGDRFNMTTGDALVEYLRVYTAMKPFPVNDIAGNLKKMIRGFRYYNDASASTTYLAPGGSEKTHVRLIPAHITPVGSVKGYQRSNADPLRITFLHLADTDGSTWTQAHCLGIERVSDHLPSGSISTCVLQQGQTGVSDAIAELVASGSRIIVCTAPSLFDKVLHAALEYPDIRFFQCSSLPSSRHVTTYYGKLHEPLFLIGLIAGLTTKTGRLGWLGPYGQPSSLTAANAFLLGARTVRPEALLLWSCGDDEKTDDKNSNSDRWENADIIRLVQEGADCILTAPDQGFGTHGITELIPFALLCPRDGTPCTSENCLASVTWDWTGFYGKLFSQWVAHRGNWLRHPAKPPFVSFLAGMDGGLPDISWQPESFAPEVRKLIRHLRQSIMDQTFSPFQGPLRDSNGQLRVLDGMRMMDREILDMDWVVDGVQRYDQSQSSTPLM